MLFRTITPTLSTLRQKMQYKNSIVLLYDVTLLLSLKLNLGIRSGLLPSGIHSNTTYAFLARKHSCEKSMNFLMSVLLSVLPHVSARPPLDGFP